MHKQSKKSKERSKSRPGTKPKVVPVIPTPVSSHSEKLRSLKIKLEQLQKKIKEGIENLTEIDLKSLKEGCDFNIEVKQICVRIFLEIYERKKGLEILKAVDECLLTVIMDALLYFNERVITNFVDEMLCQGLVNISTLKIQVFCQKWKLNPKSTFLAMLFDHIIGFLNSGNKKNLPNFRSNLIIEFTKAIYDFSGEFPSKVMDQIYQCFEKYLVTTAVNFNNFENEHQTSLPFLWAFYSCNSKCANAQFFKNILMSLMDKFSKKHGEYLSFIGCLFKLYDGKESPNNMKMRFIVLMRYQDFFLDVIESSQIEDNLSQKNGEILINRIFRLAEFCDEVKKNHILEKMVSQIREIIGSSYENQIWSIDQCQSSLYRTIISIEKALPNYPLKFYEKGVLQKPGLFHLHLIDGILEKRQQNQVKNFMVNLIQKWISCEIRDFNVLSNISKFILKYLQKSESHIETLLNFFRQLSLSSMIELNWHFFQSAFPQFPKNQLYTTIPPILSFSEQQSQIKACGFAGKTLFIERNFFLAPQLKSWEYLLYEIYDDWFYYPLKYFYNLFSSSFTTQNQSSHSQNIKIHKMITQWEQNVNKNKPNYIHSIFQLLSCIEIGSFSTGNVRSIVKILLNNYQKLTKECTTHLAWRQTLKILETHSELFDGYKKQEERSKRMQYHFLCCVIRFFDKITIAEVDVRDLMPKDISYEEIIERIKHYSNSLSNFATNSLMTVPPPPPCFRIIRLLSLRAAHNIFTKESIEKLKGEENTIYLRSRIQIIREIIFAYLQAKSREEVESLKQIISEISALQFCLGLLENSQNGHFEKEILHSKMIAFECVIEITKNQTQIYRRFIQKQQGMIQRIKNIGLRILFRDNSLLLAKYERKSIAMFRSMALNWVCENSIIRNQLFFSQSEVRSILWHIALDQDIELRIQVLSILTNLFKVRNTLIQEDIITILIILHLISCFDPRRSLRAYSEKIIQLYSEQKSNKPSFAIILAFSIALQTFNSQIGLPFYDLFDSFSKNWFKSKQNQYLLYLVLEQGEKKGYKIKIQNLIRENGIRNQIKCCQINFKTKKGWISNKDGEKQKNDSIFRNMKQVIIDKNKNSRFLKSKKDAMINWREFQELNLFRLF